MLFRAILLAFNYHAMDWASCVMSSFGTSDQIDAFHRMDDIHPILRLYEFPSVLRNKGLHGLLQLAVNETSFSEEDVRSFLRFIHNFRKQPTHFFDKFSYGLFLREEACVFEGDGFAYLNSVCSTPNDDLYINVFREYLSV